VMLHCYAAPWLSEALQDENGYFTTAEQDLAVCETAPVYHPRNPEEGILYSVVAEQLETFLARQRPQA